MIRKFHFYIFFISMLIVLSDKKYLLSIKPKEIQYHSFVFSECTCYITAERVEFLIVLFIKHLSSTMYNCTVS